METQHTESNDIKDSHDDTSKRSSDQIDTLDKKKTIKKKQLKTYKQMIDN
jgi:hypothetical protein